MLKKTGIVGGPPPPGARAAGPPPAGAGPPAALSMLALSPLAFAGDKSDHHGGGGDDKSHTKVVKKDGDTKVEEGNLSNDCEFDNEGDEVEQGVFGGSSLLGAVDVVTGAAANATSQLNTLNCNNVNVTDVIDVDSNNEESSVERTFVEDSFND